MLDIEAGSPIILIPHSSKTSDVLVADLGRLSVRNCFQFDGDLGTFNSVKISENSAMPTESQSELDRSLSKKSRTSSLSSVRSVGSRTGIITSRSVSQTEASQSGGVHLVLSETSLDEIMMQGRNDDPMTSSIYGNLDSDVRSEADEVGSSVDPGTPSLKGTSPASPMSSPGFNRYVSKTSPMSDVTVTGGHSGFSNIKTSDSGDVTMETETHRCLLDVLDVRLCDMDLFSAERVEKKQYKGKNLQQDLEFPSCVIQRQVCCMVIVLYKDKYVIWSLCLCYTTCLFVTFAA